MSKTKIQAAKQALRAARRTELLARREAACAWEWYDIARRSGWPSTRDRGARAEIALAWAGRAAAAVPPLEAALADLYAAHRASSRGRV